MNPCPFCGAPHLTDSIPSRYACGTNVAWNKPGTGQCHYHAMLWPEVQRLRAENERLRDIIRRASTAYVRDRSDWVTCAEMFAILSEVSKAK